MSKQKFYRAFLLSTAVFLLAVPVIAQPGGNRPGPQEGPEMGGNPPGPGGGAGGGMRNPPGPRGGPTGGAGQ